MRAAVVLFALSAITGTQAVLPKIAQVVTMLDNLISMIETEKKTDEEENGQFKTWSASETGATETHIGQLQTTIQSTEAAIADLEAQKVDLETTLLRVNADLTGEISQLNSAIQKRQEENSAYVMEQQNFGNAVDACAKAVDILKAHYGEGTPELQRPESALRVQTFLTQVHKALAKVKEAAKKVKAGEASVKKLSFLLQRASNPNFDTYKDSSAEAGSIVDEVKNLALTFSEDKQSAIDAESGLQRAFDTLAGQKNGLIRTLTAEKNSQESQLNLVGQGLAENKGTLLVDKQILADKQTYASSIATQLVATNAAYKARQDDRDAEKKAVEGAKEVLEQLSFLQSDEATRHLSDQKKQKTVSAHSAGEMESAFERIADRARRSAVTSSLRGQMPTSCRGCGRAAALLREKATLLHSSYLTNAAMTASGLGNDQINDVISQLSNLVENLKREQQVEKEHKEWCENETFKATNKRTMHQTNVETIQQAVNGLTELIGMKVIDLQGTQNNILAESASWTDIQTIRQTEKQRFDEDDQDTVDAISAMNMAVSVLQDFYKTKAPDALLQAKHDKSQAANAAHVKKVDPEDRSSVVGMMTDVRKEFENSLKFLRDTETAALTVFEASRQAHVSADADLQQEKSVLTVEKQTAEQGLESNKNDLLTNQGEIAASTTYLQKLGQSCKVLIDNYDERVSLRNDEKAAIQDAIKVLRDA